MIHRLKKGQYTDLLSRLLIIASIALLILLSFYWDFGLKTFEITSIYTLDTGLHSISIDSMYSLALICVFTFYIGYKLHLRGTPKEDVQKSLEETKRMVMAKFILSLVLLVVGLLILYNEFSKPLMWGYYLTNYTQISRDSLSQKIASIIALLLLLSWFLVLEIRIRLS